MRFVGDNNHVRPIGELLAGLELLDEGEHVPAVAPEQGAEVLAARGV